MNRFLSFLQLGVQTFSIKQLYKKQRVSSFGRIKRLHEFSVIVLFQVPLNVDMVHFDQGLLVKRPRAKIMQSFPKHGEMFFY